MRDNQQYWWIHSCEGETFPKEKNKKVSKVILEIKSVYTIDDINEKNGLVLETTRANAEAADKKLLLCMKSYYAFMII